MRDQESNLLLGIKSKQNASEAVHCYSLKDYGLGVTHPIRLRRSGDNAERDFTYSEIENGTLEAWAVGVAATYVITLYDQTGNLDLVQTDTSKALRMTSNGSLFKQGLETTMYGANTNCAYPFNISNLTSSGISIITKIKSQNNFVLFDSPFNPQVFWASSTSTAQSSEGFSGDFFINGELLTNPTRMEVYQKSSAGYSHWFLQGNITMTGTNSSNNWNNINSIGSFNSGRGLYGHFGTLVIFDQYIRHKDIKSLFK